VTYSFWTVVSVYLTPYSRLGKFGRQAPCLFLVLPAPGTVAGMQNPFRKLGITSIGRRMVKTTHMWKYPQVHKMLSLNIISFDSKTNPER
jgi:hypothetical protein